MISSGVWVPGSCGANFHVPSIPANFEVSSKPECPLKRKFSKGNAIVAFVSPLVAISVFILFFLF